MINNLRGWFSDHVFSRIIRNSTYLIVSNLISVFLTIYITRLLGVYNYGVLGIITSYVTNVNRFFSFRMNEMVVRYISEPYEKKDYQKAGALIKFSALIESSTSVLAFLFLVLTVKWGTNLFLHDSALVTPVLFYGLTILTSSTMETCNGVLRVINRYRSIAIVSLIQNVIVALLVLIAAKNGYGLEAILFAYFFGKVILGIVPILLIGYWLPKVMGAGWWRAPLSLITEKREIMRFTVSTNISNTINLFARDGEILWIGALLSPLYAGYYKTAMTVINMVLMPINPLIDTTYPEMMRAIVNKKWTRLKRILRKITMLSATWTISVTLGLLFIGKQLLFAEFHLFGRTFNVFPAEYLPAHQIILILLVGYGTANILFWNRTLLLSFSKAETATKVSLVGMLLKVIGTLLLVPRTPYYTEAILLTAYLSGTVIIMTVIGIRSLKQAELYSFEPAEDPTSSRNKTIFRKKNQ
jgi:O-antigen/teichoic acid export membrane protein